MFEHKHFGPPTAVPIDALPKDEQGIPKDFSALKPEGGWRQGDAHLVLTASSGLNLSLSLMKGLMFGDQRLLLTAKGQSGLFGRKT